MRLARIVPVVALALLSAGCRDAPDSERALRELLASAEAAVERKDLGTLRGYLSERYADAEGNDRRRVESLLRLWFLRHETIHLATRVQALSFPAADRAQAVVLVAMAGERIAEDAELAGLRGDLYRFELGFTAERGGWKLSGAAWRPFEPRDLL